MDALDLDRPRTPWLPCSVAAPRTRAPADKTTCRAPYRRCSLPETAVLQLFPPGLLQQNHSGILRKLLRSFPGGVQSGDEPAHTRSGDVINPNVMAFEPLQHANMREAQGAAALQRHADLRARLLFRLQRRLRQRCLDSDVCECAQGASKAAVIETTTQRDRRFRKTWCIRTSKKGSCKSILMSRRNYSLGHNLGQGASSNQ
jgi:hypothetical protein